jgi:hypothetical protein
MITLVATIILVPFTFRLEKEQEESLKFWLLIKDEVRKETIDKINKFMVIMDKFENSKKIELENGMEEEEEESLDDVDDEVDVDDVEILEFSNGPRV